MAEQITDDHLRIIFFTNGTASPKWRAEGIASRLNRLTEHEMFITDFSHWNEDIIGANLVIVEMLTGQATVDACHRQGAKVIYEADDAVIDTYGKERKNLMHIGPVWKANAIETIKKCDAVTVDNLTLKENYGRFTKKPTYVLPFYVDFEWYGRGLPEIKRITDEVRIGWFGSQGHYEDLVMVAPAIKRVLEKYPKTKFVYCGYGGMSSDRLVTEIGWGEDVFKEIPRERREFVIGVPYDNWPTKHKLLDFDIGISPLIRDYFNQCKTYTKWLEYSAIGVPGIYSPTVYTEESNFAPVKHGKTGFIADTIDDWVKYLSRLVEDEALRKKMGQEAREEILTNYDLDNHWQKWIEVYEKVVFNH
jgi:glycosyltransferase involved in cell wall biosynthesis